MTVLREAHHEIARKLDVAFRTGTATPDLTDVIVELDLGRTVDTEPLETLLGETMARFDANRAQSDAWLGPRLHASLRLRRREAARRGVWRYLAAGPGAGYVRWRWGRTDDEGEVTPASLDRFIGPDYKHALGRLWWMAEIFRDGDDYGPAARALSNQDITNTFFRMDVAHHRPSAQGLVEVLVPQEGEALTGREANAVAKAINAAATTLVLDLHAPDTRPDDNARDEWLVEDIDAGLLMRDELVLGPPDPRVPHASVEAMESLLRELLAEAPVRGQRIDAELETKDAAVA
jgi:hypothetical protein